MAALFIKDYRAELLRLGEAVFKTRHRTHVLVVTGRVAELVGEGASLTNGTAIATQSSPVRQGLVILDRVFPLVRGEGQRPGPISIGRTAENDVAIPEASISKRHCLVELDMAGARILDCGATNGVMLNGQRLGLRASCPLKSGDEISLGRFAFTYHAPESFLSFLKTG